MTACMRKTLARVAATFVTAFVILPMAAQADSFPINCICKIKGQEQEFCVTVRTPKDMGESDNLCNTDTMVYSARYSDDGAYKNVPDDQRVKNEDVAKKLACEDIGDQLFKTKSASDAQAQCPNQLPLDFGDWLMSAQSASSSYAVPTPGDVVPTLGVAIPGLVFGGVASDTQYVYIPFLGQYIAAVYRYSVGIAVIAAIVMVVYGGFRFLIGSAVGDVKKGRTIIMDAIAGLIIVLAAYLILKTINPDTLNLSAVKIPFVTLIEGDHGGAEVREPARAGEFDKYRLLSCDGFATNGQQFDASFSHYFKPVYGDSSGYNAPKEVTCTSNDCLSSPGVTVSGNAPNTDASWSFFCAVAMECSCPSGKKDSTKRCYSGSGKWSPAGERHGWAPCAPFGKDTPFCNGVSANGAGASQSKKYIPDQTVAADKNCFATNAGCQLLIDGKTTVTVTDSGSGIRGRRFDLYTSSKNSPGSVSTGVHTVKVLNPDTCRSSGSYRGGAP